MVEEMTRPTFTATAVKHDDWWMVTSTDAPGAVSQVRTLGQAQEHAREAIAFVLGIPEDSFDLTVEAELPGHLKAEVSQVKNKVRELETIQRDTAALSRKAARDLVAAGYKGTEVAAVLGVSPQRVSQLVKEKKDYSDKGKKYSY
jgi:predicted RNase H-like HicB family nuclease